MTSIRKLLLASAAISLTAIPVVAAAPAPSAPILLAQAETTPEGEVLTDPVAIAEKAVEDARAALRQAMATGDGISEARQQLRTALQALEDARANAGLPPSENPEATDELTPPPAEAPAEAPPAVEEPPPAPPAEQPPVVEEPPPAPPEEAPPPVVEEPPAPPAAEQAPAIEEIPAPPPEQAPALEEVPPPTVEQPPAMEELQPPPPPPEQPAVEPPPAPEPPPAEQPPAVEPPPAAEQPPADQPAPPPAEAQPPVEPQAPVVETAPPPVIELPQPAAVEPPPPPPPPPATAGPLDLQRFTERPKFGEVAPNAPPPPQLPQSAEAVREGTTLPAADGRVIVKHEGQITVVHDDSSRFRQRGDEIQRQQTANNTETVTIRRPDGSEIVTVFDRYGNIVQRYRKNRDGSVQVLIGDMEQPGFVGRIFGRGAQPAPPPPRRPPVINLGLGPVQLNIPLQQYIVESSRADEQQIQQTLMAPPVERIERAYSLEEVRRSGRLRDKVRRIDFDTITFDTGRATIPDNQIAAMQSIGTALSQILQQDPSQVFLIEGHTDAVGSDLSNLALSDRRAETVAQVLSYYYGIPAENLITQGYGEQFLKIPTVEANRENRRVAFRNITNLLRADAQ